MNALIINLSPVLWKDFINYSYIKEHSLSDFQLAYQSGKSTVTVLHSLVTKVVKTFSAKEIALCAFLGIEKAFDNASDTSMKRAMENKNFDQSIIHWIYTMLAKREISSELGSSSVTVRATKGCPQGGDLSPLMWSLVVDDLLRSLTERGFEVVGFADI